MGKNKKRNGKNNNKKDGPKSPSEAVTTEQYSYETVDVMQEQKQMEESKEVIFDKPTAPE